MKTTPIAVGSSDKTHSCQQKGFNPKPEVNLATHPRWKGGNKYGKRARRRKADLTFAMETGCMGKESRLRASEFLDRQMKSGPVKQFTPEEIAAYQAQLLKDGGKNDTSRASRILTDDSRQP